MPVSAIERTLEEAVQHHQSGRLQVAEQSYREVLEAIPGHPDALHLLGVAALQSGRGEAAIALISQALPQLERDPAVHSNLGEAFRHVRRFEDAVASFQKAVELQPDFAAGHANLGCALSELSRWNEAISAFASALRYEPRHPGAIVGLGAALLKRGLFDQAVTSLQRAVQLLPESAEAHSLLADALRASRRFQPAVAAAQRALALNAPVPAAYFSLGAALRSAGRLDESLQVFRQAVACWPELADAQYNLATALTDAGELEAAVAAFRRALELQPDAVDTLYNLGNTLRSTGALQDALVCYEKVLRVKPEFAEAWNNLASTLKHQGRIREALFAYREAVRLRPSFVEAHSNLLLALHYLPTVTAEELAGAHRSWATLHETGVAQAPRRRAHDSSPTRPLRIGYVSPDLYEHPVGFFMEPLLAHHDRSAFEIFCYADVARPDAVTQRLCAYARHWLDIAKLTNAALVERICNDGIDILVDLAGHTADHRLLVFAAQPAPIQVSYLGYCDTTGMQHMQYRVSDRVADPSEGGDRRYSEKLVRLPEVFACYEPPTDAPEVVPPPALARGFVTFASFHTLAKLNDDVLRWWTQILKKTPGSRLYLLARGFRDMPTLVGIRSYFEQQGIDAGRLSFAHDLPLREYLLLHAEVDILLDTYPFNGHTVACHALWMGVPVITLAGVLHCSRMVASVLTALSLSNCIASHPDEYVAKAVALAGDLSLLQSLRGTLRERMRGSPLTDGRSFAAAMESAYHEMWKAPT